jgi:DNA polymerase delta subunit 1
MVKLALPPDDLAEHFRVATWAASEISKTFKAPHDLEMEKMYHPYILYSKKRYAAIKYESPTDPGKMDVKGIALVRRDNCPLVKDVLSECLDALLFKRSTSMALDLAREHIRRVLDNEHHISKFVVSKTLRTGYKVDAQPHVYVARKILQRRGFPISSGSRVPYVFIEDKLNPQAKQATKAEDPEYAETHGLVIDRLYYVDHQLRKPMESLFEPVCDNPGKDIFEHEIVRDKLRVLVDGFKSDVVIAKRVDKNKKNKQQEITSFFRRAV